ncbi:MAG: C39 family peptidase [Chloroflexota bacterium]
MSSRARRIIILVVATQILLAIGVFALPRVVEALPGRYLVRLQNHPLTSGVVELVTTPLPRSLPSAEGAGQAAMASEQLPDIPGLPEDNPASAAAATPSPTATAPVEDAASPTPEATEPPPTPTTTPTPSPTPTPLPDRVELDDLITVRQEFNNCGPANMTIALNYWGDSTTQEQAAEYLKPNEEDRNVSPWQISDYVNEFTSLRSTVHSGGDMELLKQFIAAGFPVVIEKGYEPQVGAEGWYGHYLTVYGYDDAAQEFYSRDTYLGPFDGTARVDSYEEFNKWWQHFNYTFYVVFQPEDEDQVMAMIPDVLEEEESMWQYTAEIAREEIADDPENVFTHFNLGVSLTRLGELTGNTDYYLEAVSVFDEARAIGLPPRTLYYEHRPFMAYWKAGRIDDVLELTDAMLDTTGGRWVEEIHWYRGHALATQGDLAAARDAYAEALEVNPNFYPAQQSLDWVNSLLS